MKLVNKKIGIFAAIAALCLFAAGCGSSGTNTASQEKKDIKIGVTAGPHEDRTGDKAQIAAVI